MCYNQVPQEAVLNEAYFSSTSFTADSTLWLPAFSSLSLFRWRSLIRMNRISRNTAATIDRANSKVRSVLQKPPLVEVLGLADIS